MPDRSPPADVVPLLPGTGRPPPPADMIPREADVWTELVGAMPPGWFSAETHPVLRGLCKSCVLRDIIWPKYLAAAEDLDTPPEELKKLSAMFGTQTDAVRRASADLRLTKIARISRGPLRSQHPWT